MKARIVTTIALGLAVAATVQGVGSAASTQGNAFGRGLKLGAVIATAPPVTVTGPWLVWNAKTCKYEKAANPPASYSAKLRKVSGSPQIGYMYYGDFDAFGIANSKNIKAVAAKAGFKLNSYNLKFPSATEPLADAKTSVLKKDLGVMEANLDDKLIPRFLDIIQSKGCIPNIQMYLEIAGLPGFGAKWPDAGTTQGKWFATAGQGEGLEAERDRARRVHRSRQRAERERDVRHGAQGAHGRRLRDPVLEHLQGRLQVPDQAVGRDDDHGLVHGASEGQVPARHAELDRRRAHAGHHERGAARTAHGRRPHDRDRRRRPRHQADQVRHADGLGGVLPRALRRLDDPDPRGHPRRQPRAVVHGLRARDHRQGEHRRSTTRERG